MKYVLGAALALVAAFLLKEIGIDRFLVGWLSCVVSYATVSLFDLEEERKRRN